MPDATMSLAANPRWTGTAGRMEVWYATLTAGADGPWFETDDARAAAGHWTGTAGQVTWDLQWKDASSPLWTFPKVAWSRELLPGAQNVLAPAATFTGSVDVAGTVYSFDGARGGVAHIYSHGNAKRWGWLHADLGDGDVLEIVSAVSLSPNRPMSRSPSRRDPGAAG